MPPGWQNLHWRSRFLFGVGFAADFETRLSARPWARRTATVGGSRTSAAGIPASHVVRRDRNLMLTLRLFEDEWAGFEAVVVWGQGAEQFLWFPDANTGPGVAVYLEHPLAGEPLEPIRSEEFPQVLEVTIELRRIDGQVWPQEYFPDE